MSNALGYIGIAKKAGALAVGETEAGAVCRAGTAKLLLIASDASENTGNRAKNFITGHKTILIKIDCTKAALGELAGTTACALAAVTDVGIAASILSALAESDKQYAEAAAEMSARNEKAKKRKAEARTHERKKRVGTGESTATKAMRRKNK